MTQLADIYQDLYDFGAIMIAEYKQLPCGTDAAVVEVDGRYGIFYDLNQIDTIAKERAAAAHEWGHIVTGATYTAGATTAVIQKAERRATIAQIKKLLPADELEAAMKDGYETTWALADYFQVPEGLIRGAVDYYTGPCGIVF